MRVSFLSTFANENGILIPMRGNEKIKAQFLPDLGLILIPMRGNES